MDGTTAAAAGGGDGGIGEEEQAARLAAMVSKLRSGDALRMYSWLSQRCFADCVNTFYRKALGKSEGDCVRACVRKYMLVNSTTGASFADPATAASYHDDDDE